MTPSRTLTAAVRLVRAWTRIYTWRLPREARTGRRAEIDADLWDFQHDDQRVRRAARRYTSSLARRRLTTPESVRMYYDAVRLAILDTIVRTSPNGYRVGDARFLMGELYWRQGNAGAALSQWGAISPDPSDTYAFAYTPIVTAIRSRSNAVETNSAIDRALAAERSQWRSLSYDRLKKFGYSFDSF